MAEKMPVCGHHLTRDGMDLALYICTS